MATDGGDGAFVQIATAKGDLASLKKDFFLQVAPKIRLGLGLELGLG